MLMADSMRLDALIAELARWHSMTIVCDPDVAGLQVVGAYPLRDIDRILDALAGSLPVRIVRGNEQVRIAADSARSSMAVPQAYDIPPRRIE
jgi:ferric-dicitrate binding protein FerR (iron transport regulator)